MASPNAGPPVFEHFSELLHLEPHGPDVFVGESPEYPWGRVYGGQVVAQALAAALHTVDSKYRPHSLHAYFIRGGTSDEPVRYEVDRIRNGRSFSTRRVVARQSNGAILNLSASFQVEEDSVDLQAFDLDPAVPQPEDIKAGEQWTPLLERLAVPRKDLDGRVVVWLRVHGPLGLLHHVNTVALAYASDDVPYDAAQQSHPEVTHDTPHEAFTGASLDHSIWFHRPFAGDEWLLFDMHGEGTVGSRALATGRVFTRDGLHVATVNQEILLRRNRNFSG